MKTGTTVTPDEPSNAHPTGAKRPNKILGDALVAVCFGLCLFIVFSQSDLVQHFIAYSERHAELELAETMLALTGLGLAGFVFGMRRIQDQKEEIRRRIEAEESVKRLALHDALTGLPNRRLFEDRLQAAIARAKRDNEMLAVLMFDLDRFKPVNDLHGHPVGDKLLKALAGRVKHTLRGQDTVARFGGDEFAVIQIGLNQPDGALRLARRLMSTTDNPFVLDGKRASVSLSLGIAVYPTDAEEPEQLLRRADVALYRSKEEGRANFRFFETHMDAELRRRASLEQDLRTAIISNELEPLYQPLMDLEREVIVGFECLARWHHPQRGVLPPQEFIAIAEDSGLITAMANEILRKACRHARDWPGDLILAVNISPTQFHNPHLADDILAILLEEAFPPHRLEIELTENALLKDPDSAATTLNRLKEHGVHVALDDFGTGYSSLSHLRDLPFDKIKIDKSFVSKLVEEADNASIVKAVIALGNSLGLPTLAEGIEDEEHLNALRKEGCTLGQGYLLGKPVHSSQIPALLARAAGAEMSGPSPTERPPTEETEGRADAG